MLTVPESRVGTPVRREVLGTLAMTEATTQALWTLDESAAGLGMMSEASIVLGMFDGKLALRDSAGGVGGFIC